MRKTTFGGIMFELIKLNPRLWFLVGFLGCALLLAMGAYFQFIEGLEPCPLCISQRIAIFATGLCFIVAVIHNPRAKGIKIYSLAGGVIALLGAMISLRHVWLQHLPPDQVPECGPGLDYMLQNFPLINALKLLLSGTGECAEVNWTLLGFSMPAWTCLAFLLLAGLSLAQLRNIKT
jgi:disulfide bond formation protein DsbB